MYYDLDADGVPRGAYAVPQQGRALTHIGAPRPPGRVRWDGSQWQPAPSPLAAEQLKGLVDEEWTRRVFGTFVFESETYHADRDSVDNIIGAYTMAQEAIGLGVQAGNRYWHYPDPTNPPQGAVEFAWKSKSNGMIPMDAPTVVALGKALFAHKHAHFLAARALKEMDPIPADYTADIYWP